MCRRDKLPRKPAVSMTLQKMVGHYPKLRGHGPIFLNVMETPGTANKAMTRFSGGYGVTQVIGPPGSYPLLGVRRRL